MSAMTVEQVRAYVAQGMTDTEIGAIYGRERRTVHSFRRLHDIRTARSIGQTKRGESKPTLPAVASGSHPSTKKMMTVAEFLLSKRKAVCPVCRLKEEVKAQVMEAKKRGERQADIIEYLQECHRVTITPRDFTSHIAGRHDQ